MDEQLIMPRFIYGDVIAHDGYEYRVCDDDFNRYMICRNDLSIIDDDFMYVAYRKRSIDNDDTYTLVSRDEGARIRDLATELVMRLNSFDKALAYIEEMKLNYESNLDE